MERRKKMKKKLITLAAFWFIERLNGFWL